MKREQHFGERNSGLDLNFDPEIQRKSNNDKNGRSRKRFGSLLWILSGLILFGVVLAAGFYALVVFRLPDVSGLRSKASQFETMRILDRKENLLYEIVPPEAGRRDYVAIDEISPWVLAAVIAVEDRDYYSHPGFDIRAILRAVLQNTESGATVSGASTITQQLARNLLLGEERNERTFSRKIREIVLAAEITRRYSKDEILEIYLNENYYGNHAYGIEAAARTYFRRSAKNLNFAQASFLAGLPQAPGYYDIFSNREATLERMKTVLLLAYKQSSEDGCISIRGGRECIRVDPVMVSSAAGEIEKWDFVPEKFDMRFPHWVNYIYTKLEADYGADFLYRSGYTVYTTLDPDLQETAEHELREQIGLLSGSGAYNGAVIILHPESGDILAMVGSPDFNDADHSGQVNMSVSPRQPGSSIKPLIYASAFEKGWTPATLIWDVETDFSPTGKDEDLLYSPPYHPTNYDGKNHGPVLIREALASSFNIPAVKALQYVGIYDDPTTEVRDGFVPFAKRFHIDSLDKAGWGLSLALGGGEVTLLELTNAYAVFANGGKYVPARSILKITDHNSNIVYQAETPLFEKVLNEEYSFQITSILSDDDARSAAFGTGSVLNLSYPASVKTGTTNDYRDNWAVGYNAQIAVGVWVGNADNRPMDGMTGITGAAPVWHNIMEKAGYLRSEIRNGTVQRPAGIIEIPICADSGTMPDPLCTGQKWEFFASYQPPLSAEEGLIRQYYIDTWSGKPASQYCAAHAELRKFLNVTEPDVKAWIRNTADGRAWAEKLNAADLQFVPEGEPLVPPCGYPELELISPADHAVIHDDTADIWARVSSLEGTYGYSLEFVPAAEGENWRVIQNNLYEPHYTSEKIAEWYLRDLEDGEYRIRLRMDRENGQFIEVIHTVYIERGEEHDPMPDGSNDENEFDTVFYTYDNSYDSYENFSGTD